MSNIYVRSSRSIKSITLTRLLLLIPMMAYGIYKNGLFLYIHHHVGIEGLIKPFLLIVGSALIGGIVNIIYEYGIKRKKEKLSEALFSSFHIEYAVLSACITSINVNLAVYFGVLTGVLFLSKFVSNRINIMCIIFLSIYGISYYTDGFYFANAYETSKVFNLGFMDYLIGRGPGGIASTHIILLILALFGAFLTNNNKTNITLFAILSYVIPLFLFCLIKEKNFTNLLFSNNYLFMVSFIATDSVTSCYTPKGMMIFGTLIGLLSFGLFLINPITAPCISILIISLFNNLIDRKSNHFANRN